MTEKSREPKSRRRRAQSTLSGEFRQQLSQLQAKVGAAAASGLDRTALAEQVIDEMARRQGHRFGPYFDWTLATESFQRRFDAALAQRPRRQSTAEFARLFVDAWPRGMAALRVIPDSADSIANPPYSKDGMWPADLGPCKTAREGS